MIFIGTILPTRLNTKVSFDILNSDLILFLLFLLSVVNLFSSNPKGITFTLLSGAILYFSHKSF